MALTQTHCANRPALAAAVAARIVADLNAAIDARGSASLIVPGGTTPVSVFNVLAMTALAWNKVTIIPCDERWVEPTHADSNEGLIRKHLMKGDAARAQLESLYRSTATPLEARAAVRRSLAKIPRPFSSVFLGMGEDGHFASLFPGRAETGPALALDTPEDVMVLSAPAKGYLRMGLTLSALIAAPRVILAVTGAEKRIVLERAIANINDDTYPIAALLRQDKTPIDILLSE